jgi:hypothetical protein
VSGRVGWRRLRLGLQTLLGLGQRGFFIPYRYAAMLPQAGERRTYAAVEARFRDKEASFLEELQRAEGYAEAFTRIASEPHLPPAPRWDQSWYPPLDAALAYSFVCRRRPRLLIEIGSGHSTRFFARAIADAELATRLVAIDPAPRASLASLPIELIETTLHSAPPEVFAALGPGDMLAVDSSHILMPGSDVALLLGDILPLLPAGVLVGFHDVFLPDDYPADWDWRGYNEQLAVLQMVLGSDWELLFASHYVATRMAAAVAKSVAGRLPLGAGAFESSLWLRKLAAAPGSATQ